MKKMMIKRSENLDKRKRNYNEKELKSINKNRTAKYRKDITEEILLQKLNNKFNNIEMDLVSNYTKPELPVIFIVGMSRSGNTLASQLISNTEKFSYISNFSARFWEAPYLGLLIEKITDVREQRNNSFKSDHGVTKNIAEINEFMYFWDKWFAKGQDTQCLSNELLNNIDSEMLKKEIASIESVWQKPSFFKNHYWCSFQIEFLNNLFPNSLFLFIKRDPLQIAQSVTIARKKLLGSKESWWSMKPPEYSNLKEKSWAEQIIGQIYYTWDYIYNSFDKIPSNNYLEFNYEDICVEPNQYIKKVINKVNSLGANLDYTNKIEKKFQISSGLKVTKEEFNQLEKFYNKYFDN